MGEWVGWWGNCNYYSNIYIYIYILVGGLLVLMWDVGSYHFCHPRICVSCTPCTSTPHTTPHHTPHTPHHTPHTTPHHTPHTTYHTLQLQRYAHIHTVRNAMDGLQRQQLDLMLSIWRPHHHICENYPSALRNDTRDGQNECTGQRYKL